MKQVLTTTCVLSLLAIGLLVSQQTNAQSQTDQDDTKSSISEMINPNSVGEGDETEEIGFWSSTWFADKAAGTYYQGPDNGSIFGSSVKTIHADGTMVATATNTTESAGYGNWKRTGYRTIELTAVVFGVADGGFVAKVSETIEFSSDFSSYTGSLVTAVYAPAETDILDPANAPVFCTADVFDVDFSGVRLPVEYPACP